MECWISGSKDVYGCCRFCGRFIAKEYVQKLPFFLSVYIGKGNIPKVIVVGDTLWCGLCHPQPEPIEMPELY